MNDSASGKSWAETVSRRLSSDGFSISREVEFSGQRFCLVAHRCQFEITKFGMAETFFVFGDLPTCDRDSVRMFSSVAFQFAKKSRSIPLPCGLFESVYCFPVCMVQGLDESTGESVRHEPPPKHWAAAEVPVVHDRRDSKLYFFEDTPLWGAAYYEGFRKQIRKYLSVS